LVIAACVLMMLLLSDWLAIKPAGSSFGGSEPEPWAATAGRLSRLEPGLRLGSPAQP
jgi:hypothetical protein